jgi:hypothetical protein
METDEPHDPLHIGALGVNGILVETEHIADFIEELWLLTSRYVQHIRFPSRLLEAQIPSFCIFA